ncbi:MAG: GTPase HflX [Candidatus Marinimicrobia bacterium]|nr:GTPase HflX [Candidatus Neomarinimicrobiota bacterium]
MKHTERVKEESRRVLLIGVAADARERNELTEHLEELKTLTGTLGYNIVDTIEIKVNEIKASHYIGKGKVEELKESIDALDIDEIIFDVELSPSQNKNLSNKFEKKVNDRTGIILDIFARHARTREAKTQVELARSEYVLPRLTKMWTHLERQTGGIGIRGGMGETQIEIDRRITRTKIQKLKKELEKIEQQHNLQKQRRKDEINIALVGYTNAGKSTLMKALTDSEVYIKDELFATLDTTIRKWQVDKKNIVLLSDTVGFIRKMPPNLAASFRTTLSEVVDADLILKVADLGSDQCFKQMDAVDEVLMDLKAIEKPSITVFNKIDKMDKTQLLRAKQQFPDAVFVSALNNLKIHELKNKILEFLENYKVELHLNIPVARMAEIVELKKFAVIIKEHYEGENAHINCVMEKPKWNRLEGLFKQYIQPEENNTM